MRWKNKGAKTSGKNKGAKTSGKNEGTKINGTKINGTKTTVPGFVLWRCPSGARTMRTWIKPWFHSITVTETPEDVPVQLRQPRYIPCHVVVPGLPQDRRWLQLPSSKRKRYQYLNPIRPDLVALVIPNTNYDAEVFF